MARDAWKVAGILILVGMLVGAARGSLRAQPGARQDHGAAAKERYERGRAHHDRGDYDAAALEYLAAYELSRAPKLLFNIAQAHRLAGRRAEAISYYEQYLALEPDGELAAVSKTLVDELRQALAEDKAASEVQEADRAGQAHKSADERPAATGWARPLRISGSASAGAGLVAPGIGVTFGVHALNIKGKLDGMEAGQPRYMILQEERRAANRVMFIMYGIGGIALAAGATLYYIGRAKERDAGARDIAIMPIIGSGAAGVAACIDF